MQQLHHLQQVMIGTIHLLIDDEDFLRGYTNGYETFHIHHSKVGCIDTCMLLFLLRNGWDAGHSDSWMTGYIMGWLAAFYEPEEGQFALSTDETRQCDTSW